MGIIKTKRPVVPVPFLQAPIDELISAHSEKALTVALERFDSPHHFERPEERNLLNWYKLLNRFDELLDRYISERNIFAKPSSSSKPDKSAHKPSSPETSKRNAIDSSAEPSGTSDVDATPAKRDADTEKKPPLFSPSPALIRLVLRVSQRLIRNASHDTRNLYNSVEHLGALLADEHSAIVLLSLEILNMLMQRSHKIRSSRTQLTFELSERLLDMALGWGGRENRLGLLECCSAKDTELLPADGSRLYFEYTKSKSSSSSPTAQSSEDSPQRRERQPGTGPTENAGKKSILQIPPRNSAAPIPLSSSGPRTDIPPESEPQVMTNGSVNAIVIDDVSAFRGGERWLLSDFALRHHVPKNKLFSLLCAFRRAKSFNDGRDARLELAVLRLYALTTLFQLQPVPSKVNELLAKEAELTQDITALASGSFRDGVHDVPRCLRIIAIRCMTAMSADRHRVPLILSANGVSVHHGALPTMLRSEISFLMSSSNDVQGTLDKSLPEIAPTGAGSESPTMVVSGEKGARLHGALTLFGECNRVSAGFQRIHMTESLLALVHSLALAAGASGATPLATSGVLATLIPLLTDADIRHARVVSQAIRAMQAIVEGSAQTLGCQLFRDHDGLALVAQRIAFEVGPDQPNLSEADRDRRDEAVEVDALGRRGESRAFYEKLGRRQMSPLEALENPPPSSSTASRGLLPHSKWALVRTLHQLLLRALGNGGNEVRELVVSSKLPQALRKIMAQPFLHGGSLFQSAASVTTAIAHAEPTATAELVKAGLASTILKTISFGLPPCGEAVRCIPNLLAALCLAPSARDVIVNSKPLKLYLLRLATPFYTRALHGETPILVGSALDELMRHVEALRPDGNEAMIEYLRLSANFAETDTRFFKRSSPVSSSGNFGCGNNVPDGDTANPAEGNGSSSTQPATMRGDQEKNSPDGILLDRMKLAVANNACRLAGLTQSSSEHQQGIVQKGGLEHMIHLRYAPALASTEASIREGYSASRYYPTPAMTVLSLVTAMKNFSSRHAAAVLKSLFAVILKDAAAVLKIAKELDDRWLPPEDDKLSSKFDLHSRDKRSNDPEPAPHPEPPPGNSDDQKTGPLVISGKGDPDMSLSSNANSMSRTGAGDADARRARLRKEMGEGLKKLRVGVALLTGLPRGGSGTSAGVWETARGSQVAAIVSTVERAARYHLAVVYTGLTLSASSDGDLSTAVVTAAADPEMKALRPELCSESLAEISNSFGTTISTNPHFVEACQRYKVPPEGHGTNRQDVKGLAWCLVTFAVAAQRLYSILSKGLTFSARRLSRDPARYATSAKSLASTIGRIFTLHLMAAAPLWEVKVITMGDNRIVAAWDYIRGILIEIKGTLFDEGHRGTQSLILKAFLDAGGADALMEAIRPFLIVQAASPLHVFKSKCTSTTVLDDKTQMRLEKLLKSKSFSYNAYLLALGDVYHKLPNRKPAGNIRSHPVPPPVSAAEKEDTIMSSDSVSNQARAISRIVVSDLGPGTQSEASVGDLTSTADMPSVLTDESERNASKQRMERLNDMALSHCENVAIRRVAFDTWNTLCGFLHLLGSCPGLLASSSSPIPDPRLSQTEWQPRDIQRSALTVTLQLLRTVTSHPEELLDAFRPDGSAMADLLGIVHTTSQVANELAQKNEPSRDRGNPDREAEILLEGEGESASARPVEPDPDMLRNLVEMGFSERRAAYALRLTAPAGIEYATEWLLSHREGDDDSAGSEEAGEGRNWEIGAETRGDDEAGGVGAGETEDNVADGEGGRDEDDNDDGDGGDDEGGDEEDDDVENEEIAENEPAGNSGRDSDAADDEMEDAGEFGASDSGDISRSSPSSPEVSQRTDSGERRGHSRATLRLKKKSHRMKSLEARKNEKTLNVSADKDGRRLLELSLSQEITLLSTALEKSKAVSSSDIELFRSLAARHIGPNLWNPDLCKNDPSKGKDISIRTLPTSVDAFNAEKRQLFESLLDLTRVVIGGCESHVHGRHLPYLAVELLSIIQKDGSLALEGTPEFAVLLDKGLRLALDEHQISEQGLSGLSGQTALLWSHYGGNHARRALQSCGSFRLAYDCLLKTVGEWETTMTGPLVDIEATQPIKNLSIREDRSNTKPTFRDVTQESMRTGVTRSEKASNAKGTGLHPVSDAEAVKLKQLTTCLMLLDASTRFEAMDAVIEGCKEAKMVQTDDSGPTEKGADNGEDEKMDTDEKANEDGIANQRNRESCNEEAIKTKELSEVMREIFGSPSSAMDIDPKFDDEGDVDLETVRRAAKKKKAKMTSKAKKDVSRYLTTTAGQAVSSAFPKGPLIGSCVRLLKFWKGFEVGDALLAVLQLLGSLTSDWALAQRAIDGGIIPLLLQLPQLEARRSRSTDFRVVRLHVRTILRHLMEDPETLREAMVAELRCVFSPGQSRARPSYSMKSLVSATCPMVVRDPISFFSAVMTTLHAVKSGRMVELQLSDFKLLNTTAIEALLETRPNVRDVVAAVTSLVTDSRNRDSSSDEMDSHYSSLAVKNTDRWGLTRYALELLADFVEFAQVAAVAFIKTQSPSPDVPGTALDYIVQRVLPSPESQDNWNSSSLSLPRLSPEREEIPKAARQLFLALCSKTANTHKEAIAALSRAAKREADKEEASPGVVSGIAQCLAPGTNLRVLRVVLQSDLANDLARSLRTLDLSLEKNFEVASGVLRALSLVGQAATHLSRHGDDTTDDAPFGNSISRDPWSSLREREDALGPSGSFMVL